MIEQEYMDWLQPRLNSTPRAGTTIGRRMTAVQRARLKLRPQSTAKTHEFEGEKLTVPEIARRMGVPTVTIYARLRQGVPLSKPLANKPAAPVNIGDEMLTPKEIAARFDLPLTTVYSRLRHGWVGDELIKPRKHRGRNSR